MRSFVSSARGFIMAISLMMCVILSFRGFPLALVSWLGMLVQMTGYTVVLTTMFHNNEDLPKTVIGRFFLVCLAFAVASLGGAIIIWGGLSTINIFMLPFRLEYVGSVLGTASGIYNIDKSWGGVHAERRG